MKMNEMESVWKSVHNNLPTHEQQRVADQFARQMIRRRRFQALWLINTFFWLTLLTGIAIRSIITGKTIPGQEFGLFPLLLAPWAFAIYFLRRHLKPAEPAARGELPIVDSLRLALASNQETRSHLKLIGVLYIIMIPLLALAMHQLHVAGKVSGREVTSMAIFFGAALLVGTGGITIRYFARLRPQQRRLNALIAELAD